MKAAAVIRPGAPLSSREERVLRALTRGPLPTEEVRRIGSLNGPDTIYRLRRRDIPIRTLRRTVYDADGTPCPRALYELEPGGRCKAEACLVQLELPL